MSSEIEVHFLDVGQGLCSIVLFYDEETAERRAIVVDCGPSAHVPLAVLNAFADVIDALVVTHNHDDHAAGAKRIIHQFGRERLRNVYVLNDASPACGELMGTLIEEVYQHRHPIRVARLERGTGGAFIVDRPELRLEVLAPVFLENQYGIKLNDPNFSSGVLRLTAGNHCVVFTGDSQALSWMRIAEQGGRIECAAVTVPHHGGSFAKVGPGALPPAWFFQNAVKADFAVFSVGTANQHMHPVPSVIRAARKSGVHVLCTETTGRCCCDRTAFEELRPGIVIPTDFARSQPESTLTTAGNSAHLACAATISVRLGPGVAVWGAAPDDPEPLCAFTSIDAYKAAISRARDPGQFAPQCLP
jgi:beta-lactamase superfamily II metal-dependent hydrolase